MHFRSLLAVAALFFNTTAFAHDFRVGDLHIDHPYARPTAPGQTAGAAYLTIMNHGKTEDKLIAAASSAAKMVEIHTMSMQDNVMRMREVAEIKIAPSATVVMQPGEGYHFMLIGLAKPLKAGDKLPLTLTFEKAGKTDVSVIVETKDSKAAAGVNKDAGAHHKH